MSDEARFLEPGRRPTYDAVPVGEDPQAPSPFRTGHRILRGRYPWALALGVLLGGGAAFAVFSLVPVKFRSTGLIDIAPRVKMVLSKTPENDLLPMYENFVETQANILRSRRVTDAAMESDAWRATGRGMSDDEIAEFRASLEVEHVRGSQNIRVAYRDEDPAAAMIAVNEVIDAYMKIVEERDTMSGLDTEHKLESKRDLTLSRLERLQAEVTRLTDSSGVEKLESDYRAAIEKESKLRAMLGELDLEAATLVASGGGVAATPTPEQVALRDEAMATLLGERARAEVRLEDLEERQGFGPNHSAVAAVRAELEVIRKRIEDRMAAFHARVVGAQATGAAAVQRTQLGRDELTAALASAAAETTRLGQKVSRIAVLEQERTTLNQTLEDIKRRFDEIRVESDVHGRTTVLVRGDRPVGPDNDKRLPLAVVLGAMGFAAGFGLVLAWGVRDGRVRYIVDVEADSKHARILGIVPDLTRQDGTESGVQGDDMGEYCVHQVRAMLQLQSHGRGGVTVLTSPSPGAGKTTLGLALGLSYASTGSRTLVVDGDLVGHGLTSAARALTVTRSEADPSGSAEAGPEIMGKVVEAQAGGGGERAGDAAADSGEGATRDPASGGRRVNGNGLAVRTGILDALSGKPLDECVQASGIQNLTLLPVGTAGAGDVSSLSPSAIRTLFDRCRERYDVVLVDTGPVLGSIEAVLAASAADRVVLVVPRGERQPLVDDALRRLERIGAEVAGIVFNRATLDDVARSSYASRSTSVGARDEA